MNYNFLKFLSILHPCKTKRKRLRFYLSLKHNNNQILFIDGNKEEEINPLKKLKNLNINIKGSNNIIKISKKTNIKGLRIDVHGNNNYLEINSSKYELGSLSWIIVEYGGRVIIGKDLWVTSRLFVHCQEVEVIIGNDCVFARETTIRNSDTHTIYSLEDKKRILNPNKSVYIDDHVWITQKCTILKGVHIPSNCIIGTCSVVTKSCATQNCILSGNPAKTVKENINWDRNNCLEYQEKVSNFM